MSEEKYAFLFVNDFFKFQLGQKISVYIDKHYFFPVQVPESSELQYFVDKSTGQKSKYPLVCVKNVFIFPGIPKLMERAFTNLEVAYETVY